MTSGCGVNEPLVVVQNLSKVYVPSPLWMRFLLRSAIDEPITALDGLDLEVYPGKICAVIGPNGAGKSTLFRILTGLTTPTTGSASVLGLDATLHSRRVRAVVGFMPAEERSLLLRQTCVENLTFHGRLRGLSPKRLATRTDETLELVGLSRQRHVSGFALSSGMRTRLMLARALLHEPRVLILDEPTGPVDPVAAYEFLKVIQKITVEQSLAVLISSHRLEEIEALHDDVLLLDRGRRVYRGNLDELRVAWDRPRTELHFGHQRAANDCAAILANDPEIELLPSASAIVIVATTLRTGEVLGRLNSLATDIVSVRESRISLRELLARMTTQQSQRTDTVTSA